MDALDGVEGEEVEPLRRELEAISEPQSNINSNNRQNPTVRMYDMNPTVEEVEDIYDENIRRNLEARSNKNMGMIYGDAEDNYIFPSQYNSSSGGHKSKNSSASAPEFGTHHSTVKERQDLNLIVSILLEEDAFLFKLGRTKGGHKGNSFELSASKDALGVGQVKLSAGVMLESIIEKCTQRIEEPADTPILAGIIEDEQFLEAEVYTGFNFMGADAKADD
ncbi:hypothetical protein RUND412_001459 [Rhizina undulata]